MGAWAGRPQSTCGCALDCPSCSKYNFHSAGKKWLLERPSGMIRACPSLRAVWQVPNNPPVIVDCTLLIAQQLPPLLVEHDVELPEALLRQLHVGEQLPPQQQSRAAWAERAGSGAGAAMGTSIAWVPAKAPLLGSQHRLSAHNGSRCLS